MIVGRIRGTIIGTILCCIVYQGARPYVRYVRYFFDNVRTVRLSRFTVRNYQFVAIISRREIPLILHLTFKLSYITALCTCTKAYVIQCQSHVDNLINC